MPIYEYHCEKCGHEFEELVFGDEMPACPKCGAAKTGKLMSRPCLHRGHDGGNDYSAPASSSGGGCAGCSGGNCGSCGR